MHYPAVRGAANPTFERMIHGVAIEIDPVKLYFGRWLDGGTWTRHNPEVFEVSRRCGELALAEAWRCVELTIDPHNLLLGGKYNVRKYLEFRGGSTIQRNVRIFMLWDRWNAARVPVADRLAFVRKCGHTLTGTAFRRLIETAGLSVQS